ncbi:MAG TPA: hypothetical protein VMH83_04480, partial [Candidatus Acidoferrum sp.]|nr:hypothetical protein [Candidatus Acidoferrum sp.]
SGTYPATVKLHGMSADVSAQLRIVKLANGAVQVSLDKPLLVGAAAFGLADAVEQLRMLANLASITPTVTVGFTLVYSKQ